MHPTRVDIMRAIRRLIRHGPLCAPERKLRCCSVPGFGDELPGIIGFFNLFLAAARPEKRFFPQRDEDSNVIWSFVSRINFS